MGEIPASTAHQYCGNCRMHWYIRKGLNNKIFLAPAPEKLQHKMVEENTCFSSPGAIRLLAKEIRSSIISTRTGKQPSKSLQSGLISQKSVSRRKMPNIVQNKDMGQEHLSKDAKCLWWGSGQLEKSRSAAIFGLLGSISISLLLEAAGKGNPWALL